MSKYLTIHTTEILNILQAALHTQDIEYTIKQYNGNRRKTTKHGYEFTLNSLMFKLHENDNLIPRIVLFNSYRGESALTIHVGVFRFVCSNGLIVGGETGYSAKIRHIKGQKAQQFLDTLYTNVINAISWIKERLEVHLRTLNIHLTQAQQEMIVRNLRLSNRVTSNILSYVYYPEMRRVEDQAPTLYNL